MWRRLVGPRLDGKLSMLPSFAAAMSFYFLVSLVPFLVVVSKAIAWIFSANLMPQLVDFLREVLPPESGFQPDAVVATVQAGRGGGLGLISTLIVIWTASSGMNEMARGIHFIFSDSLRPSPGGLLRRLKSMGLLLIWVVAMLVAAMLIVLIPLLQAELVRFGAGAFLPKSWALIRYPAALGLTFVAFWLTYQLVPERRASLGASAGGAFVASLIWTLTCLLFAFLLPRVWHRSLFQGALSSLLATLIWAHCGAWGVLLGACWTARFSR